MSCGWCESEPIELYTWLTAGADEYAAVYAVGANKPPCAKANVAHKTVINLKAIV